MFSKKVVLTIPGESREVTCSFSIMLEKSFSSSSLLQLLFRYFSRILPRLEVILFWLYFRFSKSTYFSELFFFPLHGDCLGITQLTWLKTVVLLIHFTYSGCLRFPESSTIVCSRLGPRNLRYFSYWLVFQVAFK